MDDEYLSAKDAAEALGVSVATLYAYVSRKGVRAQRVPGTRTSRYWRPDIERLLRRERKPRQQAGDVPPESAITLLTPRGPCYRGRNAVDLAAFASFETVASLLWNADERRIFTNDPPRGYARFATVDALLAAEADIDRAIAHLGFLERADSRSYDLTALGMARTGADIIRWVIAIFLRRHGPSCAPLHDQVAEACGFGSDVGDLVRRMLILSADHGFEQSTFAVRAVASMGVSPWRSIATGLAVGYGRRSVAGSSDAARRLVAEIAASAAPEQVLTERLREGEPIPGFDSAVYPAGDPRVEALLGSCAAIFQGSAQMGRLKAAFDFMADLDGRRPGFQLMIAVLSLLLTEASQNVPPDLGAYLYFTGRSAGWIAHASEQHELGEAGHRDLVYNGPLPIVDR